MSGKKTRKSLRLRKPAVQAELELPPPPGPPLPAPEFEFTWWQKPLAVAGLAAIAVLLMITAIASMIGARRERQHAQSLEAQVRTLTLRAPTRERALKIAANPRSWSATPDATIQWPDPPELVELYLPVAYSDFTTFAVTIDKVDQGRMLILQRLVPDSNRELRVAINSSAFGPGEYRIRIEGYTWRGERVDAGWVRLIVK
jgi:hypothetical protein